MNNQEIDPQAIALADHILEYLGEYLPEETAYLAEVIQAYAQERIEAERTRVANALDLERQSAKQQKEGFKGGMVALVWQTREETYERAIVVVKRNITP